MEFREFLKITKQSKSLIIVLTILVTLAAFLFSYFKKTTYETSIAFAINRINRQETAEYQFDGYYSIQAADLFSQTIVSWFMTPSVLLEIYNQAGIDPQISSINKFSSRFKTKKYSPQNIVVTFSERDEATANKIAGAIIKTVGAKGGELNKTAENKALFEVIGSSPVVVAKKTNLVLNTIVGLIVGLVLSLLVVFLARYFKEDSVPGA